MKRLLCFAVGLLILIPSLLGVTALHKAAPPPERLGYKPSFEVIYFSSLEHRYLLSELLFYDASFYYGTLLERPKETPDYLALLRYIDTVTRLNAFNIDAYYFGQAVLTWNVGMVKDMNILLERGMKRRDWDFYLPFFVGFNDLYFLNDKLSAARYLERAAKLNPQMTFLPNLVGRLYYQADKTEQAIEYLRVVAKGTFNSAVRRSIEMRITALETMKFLEEAVKRFEKQQGHPPAQLSELVSAHVLKAIPPDPYGGTYYYVRAEGRVETTSKLANPGAEHDRH